METEQMMTCLLAEIRNGQEILKEDGNQPRKDG
jgi:hypothetical protein